MHHKLHKVIVRVACVLPECVSPLKSVQEAENHLHMPAWSEPSLGHDVVCPNQIQTHKQQLWHYLFDSIGNK